MSSYLNSQTYKIRLTTLSPVHIGCGEVYEPLDFVVSSKKTISHFNPETSERRSMDIPGKLIQVYHPETLLREAKVSVSEIVQKMFSSGKAIAASFEIQKVLEQLVVKNPGLKEKQEIAVDDSFISHYQTSVQKVLEGNFKDFNQFQILRTSYLHQTKTPFIPGSSLKGSFRTAVLNGARKKLSPPYKKPAETKNSRKVYDQEIMGFHSVDDDPFQKFSISDLNPMPVTERRKVPVPRSIGYAVNKKKKGFKRNEEANKGIPQIVEVLDPYAYFEGSVTHKTPIQNHLDKWSIKSLPSIQNIVKETHEFFLRRVEEEKEQYFSDLADHPAYAEYKKYLNNYAQSDRKPPLHCLFRLGRYCGAESMTDEEFRQISIPQKKPPVYDAKSGTTRFLYFKKQSADGNGLPFGWALLEFPNLS